MISLELVLFLLNGYAAGKLVIMHYMHPFVQAGGGVLIFFLLFFSGALVYFVLTKSTEGRHQRAAFFVVAAVTVVALTILAQRQVAIRQHETQATADNDGAVQSRAAATFLLHGQNPYTADYRQTDFRIFPSPAGPGVDNAALDHYAYLPLQFLLMVPIVWVNSWAHSGLDTQLLYVVFFLLYSIAVILAGRDWTRRTRLLLLTAANPFLYLVAFAGFNDVVFVALVSAAALFFGRRQWLVAAIFYGLALASKQTLWATALLWVILVWGTAELRSRRQRVMMLLVPAGVLAVTVLPFVIMNPGAFFDDTIRYVSGAIPMTYPLSGNTFLQYLRTSGVVSSPWSQFAAWPFQLVAWSTTSFFAWRQLRKQPAVSVFLGWSAMLLLSVFLVSRFSPDNYFIAVIELGIMSYALQPGHHEFQT